MNYNKRFDPGTVGISQNNRTSVNFNGKDKKSVYVYDENIILAINVAMVTERPILVRGPSGWGKSTLARNVANVLGWRYYEKVISSNTQAHDLLYEVDHLRRLQDAELKKMSDDYSPYIIPGILWKAFDLASAAKFGYKKVNRKKNPSDTRDSISDPSPAVVLLDEIDKADPDLPNNLLGPLESLSFCVDEIDFEVRCDKSPLIVLTTNDERELPPAFLRRCVELKLKLPDLLEVGKVHFSDVSDKLLQIVADIMKAEELDKNQQSMPSPAEYIDTIQSCVKLGITPESELWGRLTNITAWKHGRIARSQFERYD